MTAEAPIVRFARHEWGALPRTLTLITAAAFLAAAVLWAFAGLGYFWPAWIAFAGFVPVSLMELLPRAVEGREGGPWEKFAINAAICGWVAYVLFLIWLFGGGGYYWPLITTVVLAFVVAVHYILVRSRGEETELQERVTELTRTRRGALDAQAQELRRIERDLHDGAQARLVALSMQLGRAEERLGEDPEARELVRSARTEAGAAIAELRDLARGIAPPVLADRGLPAAVEALGTRSAIPVEVHADVGERPPPVVETTAYFVAAEALTNVAKHAQGPARVTIDREGDTLRVAVSDEGPGGADAAGSGLAGLRSRVEALDGTLAIDSATGAGTTITAELPCA
jgi:signal transduction histidine kinase